ncbi:biotin--[acetyl-CoA-carboxylase] ligase [Weissella diestrammenae]|uniref:biotin--[acetyl-CoA-carboxylase] ligase n=1 Tax=Weissella diestrammenae TaxID=1162633 RepID=UPI0019614DB1|nr:biotin--[acetyl-CoA-carboxylase] ligase [Weissella diestrammenae]MCM0583245.1 biotin--[acetyl-CoA-carboxylase] ligase [Weissella diestrammenae]
MQNLMQLLATDQIDLLHFETVSSTNAYAKKMVQTKQLQRPLAILTDTQTAGYGRQQRAFYSPRDKGIYLTLVLPITMIKDVNPGRITTNLAVIAVQTIEKVWQIQLQIKWVNDLYLGEHKVGGILAEVEKNHLVVGIGLNIVATDYPDELQQRVRSLNRPDEFIMQREAFTHQVISRWVAQLQAPADYLPQYHQLSNLIHRQIVLLVNQQIIAGYVLGFDNQGGIIVKNNRQEQIFYSGEVTKILKAEGLET